MSDLIKDLDKIGKEIVDKAQDILKLNGAYKTGKLFKSFKIKVKQETNGIRIEVENDTKYAQYINYGTYQWKGDKNEEVVKRKYDSIPNSTSYPFNKKGIEPILFLDPLTQDINKLVTDLGIIFTKDLAEKIVEDFNKELKNK